MVLYYKYNSKKDEYDSDKKTSKERYIQRMEHS